MLRHPLTQNRTSMYLYVSLCVPMGDTPPSPPSKGYIESQRDPGVYARAREDGNHRTTKG